MRPKFHRQTISPPCPSRQSRPCRSPESGASDRVADRLPPPAAPPALLLEFTWMTYRMPAYGACQSLGIRLVALSSSLRREASARANEARPVVEKRLGHRHERLDLGTVALTPAYPSQDPLRPGRLLGADPKAGRRPVYELRSAHYASAGSIGQPKSSGRLTASMSRSVRILWRRPHSCLISRGRTPCSRLVICSRSFLRL